MEEFDWKRGAATFAYVPLAFIFFSWGMVTGAMTRGPAGIAAAMLLGSVGLAFCGQAFRVATRRAPIWGIGTKAAAGLDAAFALYFLLAVPYLQTSFRAAYESTTKENLVILRRAIGKTPPARLSMLVPNPLPIIPDVHLPRTGHPISREVIFGPPTAAADRGVWLYDNNSDSPTFGTVIVDCQHTDSTGERWSAY